MAYIATLRPLFLLKIPSLNASARLVRQLFASFMMARRKRRTLAIIQSLPLETLKDIGWKTGN